MRLRRLSKRDIKLILEWMQDEEIAKFFRFDSSKITYESVKSFIDSANSSESNKHFAIVSVEDEYLGTISLKNIDLVNKNAEYAIALHQNSIGKGIASTATELLLNKAFSEYGLQKIYLNVLEYNQRAIRFYEKMGFVYEGTFNQHVFINEKYQNLHWYAKFKEAKDV